MAAMNSSSEAVFRLSFGFDAPADAGLAVVAAAELALAAEVLAAFALAGAPEALALAALPVGAFSPPAPQAARSVAEARAKPKVRERTVDVRSIKCLPFNCR